MVRPSGFIGRAEILGPDGDVLAIVTGETSGQELAAFETAVGGIAIRLDTELATIDNIEPLATSPLYLGTEPDHYLKIEQLHPRCHRVTTENNMQIDAKGQILHTLLTFGRWPNVFIPVPRLASIIKINTRSERIGPTARQHFHHVRQKLGDHRDIIQTREDFGVRGILTDELRTWLANTP